MATAGVTSKISQEMSAASTAPEADQDESLLEGNPAAEEGSNRQATIFWFGALMLVSVWMTVGNKIVMTDFHYPNYVTLLQNTTAVGFLMAGNFMGWIKMKPMTTDQWKVFLGCAVLLVCQIISSLLALPRVAIATTIAFRNLATCLTAILEATFFGKEFSAETIMAMVVTMLGMFIYAGFDINYDFTGYFWLAVNALSTTANMLYNRFYISKYTQQQEQTAEGISLIQQVESLPLVVMMVSTLVCTTQNMLCRSILTTCCRQPTMTSGQLQMHSPS